MSVQDFLKMSVLSYDRIYLRKEGIFLYYMQKDKEKALNLLKQKVNGEIKITYREITK